MMRKIKNDERLEFALTVKDEHFIKPPREAQRNALLNSAVREFIDDLYALDGLSRKFVTGNPPSGMADRTQAGLSDNEIMEDWQLPVMLAMVEAVARPGGSLLEIGFGRGVSADMIQARDVGCHTIMECNNSVIDRFHHWKEQYPGREIHLIPGLWQDTIDALGCFDAIFFHTYPLNEDEYMEYVYGATTFAEHFFPIAAAHLNPGGDFTYFSNEIDSLSRAHQRQLLRHFSSFTVEVVQLQVPDDVQDTWWAQSMAIIKAKK